MTPAVTVPGGVPSFEKVNYSIRPNKNVERKLMLETIERINERIPLDNHKYIGMGSLWFVDFIMMHRRLGLADLVSFERPTRANRARFNRPYACIRVDPRDFADYIDSAKQIRKPLIAWVDSDEKWNSPIVGQVITLAGLAPANSLIVLTLDATIPEDADNDAKYRAFRSVQKFDLTDNATAESFAPGSDLGHFADLLARSILDQLVRTVRLRGLVATELFNLFYRDSAPMITVGILVQESPPAIDTKWLKRQQFWVGERTVIEVPHLTPREKLSLDTQMGGKTKGGGRRLKGRISRIGIPADAIRSYRKFYKYYPVFLESEV